jgi:prolyl-tRNA editing enzyme YbaK/EbsC (Cys-tRNA(Pro) deacylase)
MGIKEVKSYFESLGMSEKVLEFEISSATVTLAAQALNTEPKRIAKTLSFAYNGSALLIVTAGDSKVDNAKFKQQFGLKARMLGLEEAFDITGHPVGGVCPFALKQPLTVALDISMKRFETVFPACGSANSAIELTPSELEKYAQTTLWVDVCKDWI